MGQNDEVRKFSFQTRTENLLKLESDQFDILIIGGGITGAGVARDAALRGLKVALVEENDFAFGTSSRSSKLVHGGIRYLENLDFHLVFEALSERNKLFEMTPHLAHPLRFMIPLYESSRVGMFKMGLGMLLYDALALFQAPELHERLNAQETIDRMKIIKSEGLKGSYVYSDGYMDDDRLVHETLRSANQANAVCVNYVSALKSVISDNGKVQSVIVQDLLSKKEFKIHAQHVISTVGPWTDLVGPRLVKKWNSILRPTKGVHLTFLKNRLPLSSAVVMAAEKSQRIVFAIPRHEMVIIGTTDTDFKGNPADVHVTQEDIQYLLEITNQYFPGAQITEGDIVSSYAGVRPLVKDDSENEGKTSREHTILHDDSGFTFVAGGKYTTYRLMSEQIVDQCLKFFEFEKRALLNKCSTEKPFNSWTSPENYFKAIESSEGNLVLRNLAVRYGAEAFHILNEFKEAKTYWQCEAYQAIHTTMCLNLTDFYSRRVPLFLAEKDHGLQYLNEIAEVFQKELHLSEIQIKKQINDLQAYIAKELSWKTDLKVTGL